MKDAVSIRQRPAAVEDRAVPGHWEGDLLSGPNNTYIATLVERQTRYVMLAKVACKDTRTVIGAYSIKGSDIGSGATNSLAALAAPRTVRELWQRSGPVPPFALAELNNHGSLFATRPKLNDYVSTRKELLEGADTLFAAVINGKLHVPINHAYALKDAAKAHTELESRATTGAAILRP